MLHRDFLFSVNNPCDTPNNKIIQYKYTKMDTAIFKISKEITVTLKIWNSVQFVFYYMNYRIVRGEIWRVAIKDAAKTWRINVKKRINQKVFQGWYIHVASLFPIAKLDPMIYEEQFGDDDGRCITVAAPVYRRYPISATADGSCIYRPIGCHRYCNSLLIVRRLFDHWRDL